MKQQTLIIVVLVVFCGSKYTSAWTITPGKIDIIYLNYSYVEGNVTVSKINRTNFAVTVYALLKINVPANDHSYRVEYQLLGFFSNQYRRLPLATSRNLCDFFNVEFNFLKRDLLENGHIPSKCPIRKGFYYVEDFIPTTRDLPNHVPWKTKKYCTHAKILNNNDTLIDIKIYFDINDDDDFVV